MNLLKNTLLFLFLPVFANAQQNSFYEQARQKQLDSLHLALKHAANDTIRMDLYQKLSFYFMQSKRDSSLYFREEQLAISKKLKLKIWEADALCNIGFLHRYLGNYPRSLQFLLNALSIANNPESEKIYWLLSKTETPRKARLNVLASTHLYMGVLYGDNGNLEQQLFHFKQCQKFAAETKNWYRLSLVNMNLGTLYINLNKLDSALAFTLKSLDYNDQATDKRNRGLILINLGTIYSKKANFSLAKQYFLKAIEESKKQNNLQALAGSQVSLANLLVQIGDIDSSLWYANKGLEIFLSIGSSLNGLVSAYTSLSSIYKLRNNIDSAFKYQGLAIEAKDSLNNASKITQFQNIGFDEQLRQKKLEDEKIRFQNKIRTYVLIGGIAVFMLIVFLLLRNNRNRKKANTQLQKQKADLQTTLSDLKNTQAQLIQSEKMASLGELTAGIAHEIQNPLNFVNNFSEVNKELIAEMREEIKKGNYDEVNALAKDIEENEEKINHHGKRADAIVKGMLQHSRNSSGLKEPTDINALADEYLHLAYHGLRARDKSFNAIIKTDYDKAIGNINIIPQDIGRVILNLITNAFYAVDEKKKSGIEGYEPTVSVRTKKINDKTEIRVADNGNGIPQKLLDKIFQPFFTTKPTGQGTGLGLSLSYDIVKAHGGELKVETKEGEGSEFIIQLPAV